MRGEWLVHKTAHPRFPFRIEVRWGLSTLIVVRTAEAWPGPKGNVFCLRTTDDTPTDEPVERVPIVSLSQRGALLDLILDRPQRKRCNFLTVPKGNHEMTFLRTEAAIKAHRTRGHVHTKTNQALDIVIDSRERYPWHFPDQTPRRRALPAGDYALLDATQQLVAVVERKAFQDAKVMLADFQAFSLRMSELAGYTNAALVIEAQYADFLSPEKMAPASVSVIARKLAALDAAHPSVRIVYAGNRKLAEHWTARYFEAVATARSKPDAMEELQLPLQMGRHQGGVDSEIRAALLQLPDPIRTADVQRALPAAPLERIRAQLHLLVEEGTLVPEGHGRGRRWRRVTEGSA